MAYTMAQVLAGEVKPMVIDHCQVGNHAMYSNGTVRDGKPICFFHEEEAQDRILDQLEAMPGPMAGRIRRRRSCV